MNLSIPILCNETTIHSYFIEQQYCLDDYNDLFISSRQTALSFHHRVSELEYFSDWHVSGDPTLILIHAGILRIGLQDESYHNFSVSDVFIVQDMLPVNTFFDNNIHRHKAQVIGNQQLIVLHLKFSST